MTGFNWPTPAELAARAMAAERDSYDAELDVEVDLEPNDEDGAT